MRNLFCLILVCSAVGCEDKRDALVSKVTAPTSQPSATAPASTTTAAATASAAPKRVQVCADGPTVESDDKVMMGQIRLKLSKKPTDSVKVTELGNIRSINLTESKTMDAVDRCFLPKMTGLKHLYLGSGDYDDLAPIAGLVHLETLRASVNHVTNLAPIEKMTAMDRLDLGRTKVSDISALSKMESLTELQLDDTEVSDVSPLAKCKKLQKVSLRNTRVVDVSALRTLTDLKSLDLSGTAVTDWSVLGPQMARGLRVLKN